MRRLAGLAFVLTLASGGAYAALCQQNKELESVGFRLRFSPDSGGSVEHRFRFGSCRVEDRDDRGEPVAPRAVRRYSDPRTGYSLIIATITGAPQSTVTLSQDLDKGALTAGVFGDWPNAKLLSRPIEPGPVSIADYRGTVRIARGTAVLTAEK